MGAEIDRLEVVIESQASKANQTLDQLTKKLEKMSGVLSGIDMRGLGNFSKAIINTGKSASDSARRTGDLSSRMSVLVANSRLSNLSFRKLTSVLGNYASRAAHAQSRTRSLSQTWGSFYATFFPIIRGLKAVGKALGSSMDYIETYNYFNVAMGKIATEFSNQWQRYGYDSAEAYADSFTGRLNELTKKMSGFEVGKDGVLNLTSGMNLGLDPEQIMSYQANIAAVTNSVGLMGENSVNTAKALSMLAADMSSFKNVELSTVMTNFQSGLIGQSRALYKYGIDITNATLQTYAYKYGLRTSVSEMTQADKMQLRLLAILDQSKVAWGDQANTINSVANQYRILKQQISNVARMIGNLLMPVIQRVLPFINGLMIAIQRLIGFVGGLFGIDFSKIMDGISSGYGGIDTEGLTDGTDDVADSVGNVGDNFDKAAERAKKLQRTILGFDQINKLNDDSSDSNSSNGSGSGGGGIGGAGGIDLSDQIAAALADYEAVWNKAFENSVNKAQEYADKICAVFNKMWRMIKAGDYEGLGEYIAGGVNLVFEKINSVFNWEKLGPGITAFVDGYCRTINSLVDAIHWDSIGKTIGDGVNVITNTLYLYLTGIDWINIGAALADGLNGMLNSIDWGMFGKTIGAWMMKIPKIVYGFVTELEWDSVGLAIGTSINGILTEVDEKLIAGGINNLVNGILDAIITAIDKTNWEEIGRKIGTFLLKIDFSKIAVKIAKVLWKSINAAVKTYSSMFSKAPVETALLSLLAIPKVIDSKLVKSISKLSTTSKLLIGVFAGNTRAIGELSKNFPKLSKATDVLGDSFQRLMFGVHYGDLKGGINAALTNISNNLSAVQKGVIGAVGVFAEFSLMKSAFYDMASGSENLIVSLGKITAGAGVAVAALKLIGLSTPWTAAIAGATAVISSIVGIGKAMDEIQAEAAMTAVGNALKAPGGTPLSEITESYQNMVSGISASFDAINRKAEELETTKNHAKETSSSIDLIKFALENGSTTAQEKIPELNELFNGLLADSKSIFEQEYDVIMLGISGSLGQSLIDAGYSIEQIVGLMDNLKTNHQRSIDEITAKNTELEQSYANGEISNAEYSQALMDNYSKLAEISGKTDEYSEAIGKVSDAVGTVDLSKFINADNTLNTEKLANEFGKMSDTANDAKESIFSSSESLTSALKDYENEAKRIGDSQAATAVSDMLSNEAKNVDLAVGSVDSALLQYGDTVQTGLLEKIPGVVDEALADYENQSWGYKFLHSEEEHVQAALDEYKTNVIDQASQKLEEMYSAMGIEGAGWGSDAAKSIIDGLYNTTTTYSLDGAPIVTKTLNDNYRKIVTGATEGIRKEAEKGGRYTIEGYNQGISENVSQSNGTVSKWQESIRKAIHDSAMKYGSPSKTAKGYGKDTISGFNLGLNENTATTINIIKKWLSDIANAFPSYKNQFIEFGKSYMLNFKTGIESQRESVISSARNVINALKNIFPSHTTDFRRYGSDYMKNLASGISGSSWDATRAAQSVASSIKSVFSGMSWDMYNSGRSVAQSFANGFASVHVPTPHMYASSYTKHTVGDSWFYTPNFNVSWYASGGLFTRPTIAGFGEAGDEAALPLENQRVMRRIASSIVQNMNGKELNTGRGALALEKEIRDLQKMRVLSIQPVNPSEILTSVKDMIQDAIVEVAMAMSSNNDDRPYVINLTVKTEDNEVLARACEKGMLTRDERFNPTPKYAF